MSCCIGFIRDAVRAAPGRIAGLPLLGLVLAAGLALGPAASCEAAKPAKTEKFGSSAGDKYQRGGRDQNAWIIGFTRTTSTVMGKPMIGMLDPVYERTPGEENETDDRIVAKEGYVVGEVDLDVDTFVRAVRVKFVRLTADGKLDPSDSYHSRWIGRRKNKRTKTLPGPGQKIVGIYGSADEAIRSLGLLVVPL